MEPDEETAFARYFFGRRPKGLTRSTTHSFNPTTIRGVQPVPDDPLINVPLSTVEAMAQAPMRMARLEANEMPRRCGDGFADDLANHLAKG